MPGAISATPRSSQPSPSVEGGYPLSGPSNLPDPATHAYRQDLADTALAGRVIASHYADPLLRHLVQPATLLSARTDGEAIAALAVGDEFRMLDCTGGWAWGYGPDGRVGYVPGDSLGF